ncbi:MAG: hypothetical protein AB7T86_17010 [Xanthobacteraceae bacterium]|uniref:hypothetical protein n=1 Tax=Pseudolabrys sp. TaxID=1960880 RepID=UPI003D13DD39
MRHAREFLASFSKKFFHDALPVAFASLLGALALTYAVRNDQPQPAAHSAAGEEMVRLVHEEHGLIVDFLRQQARKQEAEAKGQDMAQKMDAAAEKAAASRQIAQTETVPLPVPRATAMRLAAEQSRAEAKLAQTAQPLTQQVLAGQVLTQTIVPQPPLQPMPVVAAAPRKHGVGDTVRGIVTGTRDAAVSAWAKVTGGVIERVRLPGLPEMPDLMPRREFQARM